MAVDQPLCKDLSLSFSQLISSANHVYSTSTLTRMLDLQNFVGVEARPIYTLNRIAFCISHIY